MNMMNILKKLRNWISRGQAISEPTPDSWFKFSNEKMVENADYMICCLETEDPKAFNDNIRTKCCECKRTIIHRPEAPKRPKKICLPCVKLISQRFTDGG